jgi:hypothetical protein
MQNRSYSALKLFIALAGAASLLLPACSPPCNGRIECLVLYAKPGAGGQGRNIYVNVLNKPDLGVHQMLLLEGKEFGTFDHIAIIHDPKNQYAPNRSICFNTYQPSPVEADAQLDETRIPRLRVVE